MIYVRLVGCNLKGLMTMAPIQSIHGDARPVFSRTKKVFDSLKGYVKAPNEWDTLSMGMSQDYDIAIEGQYHSEDWNFDFWR